MFLSHTNSVYGALHCALLLMITTHSSKGLYIYIYIYIYIYSLRTSCKLSSSWVASTLTCWRSISSCFLANFLISFVTIFFWSLVNFNKVTITIWAPSNKPAHNHKEAKRNALSPPKEWIHCMVVNVGNWGELQEQIQLISSKEIKLQ